MGSKCDRVTSYGVCVEYKFGGEKVERFVFNASAFDCLFAGSKGCEQGGEWRRQFISLTSHPLPVLPHRIVLAIVMDSGDAFFSCPRSNGGHPPAVTARHLPLFFTPPSFFLRPNTYDYPENATLAASELDLGASRPNQGPSFGATLASASPLRRIRRMFSSNPSGRPFVGN